MTISILVLKKHTEAFSFSKLLQESSTPVVSLKLIQPHEEKNTYKNTQDPLIEQVEINDVMLLNPKLSQKIRQRKMSLWLMPFGLIAGVTFSGMTDLDTFSKLGFGSVGETIIGGLLGMGSGLIGSFFAASSVNPYKKDVESLQKKNQQGKWLLLLETPLETDLPWTIIKEINPLEIVRLSEI